MNGENSTASMDFQTATRPSNLQLAYQIGTTLNRLTHLQVKAWLCTDATAAADAAHEWDQLSLHAGELSIVTANQDQLRLQMRESGSQWLHMYESEWRSESLHRANLDIEEQCRIEGRPDCRIREEEWQHLLRAPLALVHEAQDAFERSLSEAEIAALRLAMYVGQLTHPTAVSHEVWDVPEPQCAPAQQDGDQPVSLGEVLNPHPPTLVWHFPISLREGRPFPPAGTWWRELQQRWASAGLAEYDCPTDADFADLASHGDLSAAIDACILDAHRPLQDTEEGDLAQEETDSDLPFPGDHLGLHFDNDRQIVTRDNREGATDHLRPVLFQLGKFLATRGVNLTTREELKKRWVDFGGADGPEDSTMDATLSELRSAMRVLGVRIDNRTNRGWRLIDG